jgi:CSLREA domain-containing protein
MKRSHQFTTTFGLLALLLASAVFVIPAYAAGIVVNSNADNTTAGDGFCTLREAITNANTDSETSSGDCIAGSGTDTITFAGNYTITLAGSQLPPITSTITISGIDAANTIIEASTCNPNTLPDGCTPATSRIFELTTLSNLTLDGLTIRHGVTGGRGGGIYMLGGTLTVSNSILSGNRANGEGGGGIFNNVGTVSVSNSTITGNYGANRGGGIQNNGTASNLTVTNSTISGNTSGNNGGALYNINGTALIVNSTIAENSAVNRAGGIDNTGISGTGNLSLVNSTLSGNSSDTMATNSSGVRNTGGNVITLTNTIIANSQVAGVDGLDVFNAGTITASGINLVEDPGTVTVLQNGTNPNVLNLDPLLGPLTDNGGSTQTFALMTGSPAIDKGDNTVCASEPVNNKDQRGITRPQGDNCDLGAFEWQAINIYLPIVRAFEWQAINIYLPIALKNN